MNYEEEALKALRSGVFDSAATLLKHVVEENQYASPVLNNAYTLALHKTSRQSELAEASFQIGNRSRDNDPAAAMDYFQRALFTGISAIQVRQIGEWHEQRAAPRNVDSSGPEIRTDRVAHVVGCLLSGHAPSLYVQLLSKALRARGVESYVFTTEWAANWFFNPPGARQSEPIEIEAQAVIAEIDGNFEERADRVAAGIRNAKIDIAFYHNSLTEQITTRVAGLRPARLQINVNHAEEVAADLFDGFVHLFENGVRRTRFPFRPFRHIPLISDIEERLSSCARVTRQSLGIDSAQTVSGTFGSLYKVSDVTYLQALAQILKRFPAHFHIFAGSGDNIPIKEFFLRQGLSSRILFLGHMPDVAPLFDSIDVYLNSFPHSGGQSVLEPMASAKPVVIRRYAEVTHQNVGAELAGLPDLNAASDDEYVEIAQRLLQNPDLRRTYGELLRQRFQANFRPARLAE
ncbi:MAG TPA: glycosyltransferase family 4 protein, partial [Terriglobia bacterium]|nr:glycosyltransferase family 4 protein [Terriglobia bacterium]